MKLPATIGAALGAAVISVSLMGSPALAGNPCAKNPCGVSDKNPCAMKERKGKHHKMKKEHMGMMREVMVILRDLNHKPTAEQKKRLDHYIEKLDDSLAKCELWEKEGKDGKHHKRYKKEK